VGDILNNRLAQQKFQQEQFSDLAKTIQAQRQNEAFGEQASNAGLLPGVDTSNMNVQQTAALAKLISEQGSEASLNAQRQAMAKWIGADKPLAGGRGGGASSSGGNTVDIYDDQGNYVTSAPSGSVLARQYLAKTYPSLNPGMTASQAAGQAKALGIPEADFFDSSRHYGYQTVPGGVDQQGNAVPLPLSPDQDPSEATHVGIKPSTATNPNAPPIIIPRSVFSGIRQGLGANDSSGNVTPSPGVRPADVQQAQQALQPGSSAPPPATQTQMPQQRFGSEADARGAGYGAGDTVMLFDPDSKQYRPAVLH
jgi:hypothetical protein